MLVQSRTEGEQLVIGDDVIITVVKVTGKKVSIGISAPKDIRIFRRESIDRKPDGKETITAIQQRIEEGRQFSGTRQPLSGLE